MKFIVRQYITDEQRKGGTEPKEYGIIDEKRYPAINSEIFIGTKLFVVKSFIVRENKPTLVEVV